MSPLVQNIIVGLIVLACVAYVSRQFLRTFAGKRGKLGSCCSKGCEPIAPKPDAKPREHFIPSDALTMSIRSRKRATRS
ncbi:MAG: FeoB-associated Cys-rich membrane protein [Tepidisphaeraceae bacterium]